MATVGIIGAGHIGKALAQAFIGQGYEVVIANSRGPETLDAVVAELGPHARAGTASEAAEAADVAVVTIPFKAYLDVPVEPLAGKIVIDTNNYYWERDGHFDAIDRGEATSAGLLQEHLAGAKVVKVFNNIRFSDINTDGHAAGSPERRALPASSDYPEAVIFVTDFLDQLGFDAVDASPLSESWRFERDRPAYSSRQTREELVANLAMAPRTI
jgi:predicted dinucleotide-binding enzyme